MFLRKKVKSSEKKIEIFAPTGMKAAVEQTGIANRNACRHSLNVTIWSVADPMFAWKKNYITGHIFLFIQSFLFPTTKVKLIEDKERKTHNIILQVMR